MQGSKLTWLTALLAVSMASLAPVADVRSPAPRAKRPAAASPPNASTAPASNLIWQVDYAATLRDARREHRPVIVLAGAEWCVWCKRLDGEIETPEVQAELRHWARVYIDVDQATEQARDLTIGPIPAFRVLTPNGRVVGSRDGYMKADRLASWLQSQREAALGGEAVAASREPTEKIVERLIGELQRRDPAVREAAVRRLILVPKASALPVVDALAAGDLSSRLAAREILDEWAAPVTGIDPWRPETVDERRLEALRAWAADAANLPTSRPSGLTERQHSAIRRDIERLLREETSTAEADAIRERLARYRDLLLPDVYAALRTAVSDAIRERLTALRYRLVASDALVFSWPGGIERLAAMDVAVRHRAADELAARATADEEPLLLEMFSDPDSLVREISLRALHRVAGARASDALIRLLGDPEPNVRAAVLKQLAESPSAAMVPKIAEYVAVEEDPDLIVHAIRALRASPGSASAECLMSLLAYPSWQVRAEAAEGLGELLNNAERLPAQVRRRISESLVAALDDSDGFVVSTVVKALRHAERSDAVEGLAEAADRHPELAADVLSIFVENSDLHVNAVPYLRRFCAHARPSVRALAVGALCSVAPNNAQDEMRAALADESSRVRGAAAESLLNLLESYRREPDDDEAVHVEAASSGGLLSWLFGSRSSRNRSAAHASDETPATAVADGNDEQPTSGPAAGTQAARIERWLVDFRAGQGRPKWADAMVPALESMLVAESADERTIAAVTLLPFARDDAALAVLTAAVREDASLAATAARGLGWLPWDKRLDLFRELCAVQPDAGTLARIAEAMTVIRDPRAAEPLWGYFETNKVDITLAGQLLDALRRAYFGNNFYYNAHLASAERRRPAIDDAKARARSGPELQRLVALALLLGVSLQDAAAEAAAVAADPDASEALRFDAFQIQLLADTDENRPLAVAALAGDDPDRRKLALRFLAEGGDNLRMLRGRMYLFFDNEAIGGGVVLQSGTVVKVEPPSPGLTAEMLHPFLADGDPRVAAHAGYLLATLGDGAGFDALVNYWRDRAKADFDVRRLVYRAVTALNDDGAVPLLEEIYQTFAKDDYWLRDFYWTIRGMDGPEAKELRKKIRKEVGMDNLR